MASSMQTLQRITLSPPVTQSFVILAASAPASQSATFSSSVCSAHEIIDSNCADCCGACIDTYTASEYDNMIKSNGNNVSSGTRIPIKLVASRARTVSIGNASRMRHTVKETKSNGGEKSNQQQNMSKPSRSIPGIRFSISVVYCTGSNGSYDPFLLTGKSAGIRWVSSVDEICWDPTTGMQKKG
ncbi:hypothetical protein FPQ18DRAFT_308525 [Pyronema domesticum]|nr:hypothetical protein FPQ18DRAFT_308525 [Pyronema domesticum]